MLVKMRFLFFIAASPLLLSSFIYLVFFLCLRSTCLRIFFSCGEVVRKKEQDYDDDDDHNDDQTFVGASLYPH